MLNAKTKNSFLKDSLFSFFVRILGAISVFFFNLVIARTLPISDAGAFFLSFSVLIVLWNIGSLGMPMAIVRFVGTYNAKKNWRGIDAVMSLASRRMFVASVILGGCVFFIIDGVMELHSIDVGYGPTLKVLVFVTPVIAPSHIFM